MGAVHPGTTDILRRSAKGALATLRPRGLAIALALRARLAARGRPARRASGTCGCSRPAFVELFRALPLVLLILFFFGSGSATRSAGSGALVVGADPLQRRGAGRGVPGRDPGRAARADRGGGRARAAPGQMMRLILVPQAVRTMLPAIVSQLVVRSRTPRSASSSRTRSCCGHGAADLQRVLSTSSRPRSSSAAIYIAMNLLAVPAGACWLERRQSAGCGHVGPALDAGRGAARPLDGLRPRAATRGRPRRPWSAGDLGGPGLADHGDPDLAGVGQLLLDLLGHLAGEHGARRGRRRRPGCTMTRISRPACMAKTFSTPGLPAAISSIRSSRLTYASRLSRRAPGRPPEQASAAWVSTASMVLRRHLVVVRLDGVHDVLATRRTCGPGRRR